MKILTALLVILFSLNGFAANSDWKKNRDCINVLNKYALLPDGITLAALQSGGLAVILSDSDNSFSVWNGKKEAAVKGMYPSFHITSNGGCDMNRQSGNGTEYFSTALAKAFSSDKQKANELVENCKNAPAFAEATEEVRGFNSNKATSQGKPAAGSH